MTEPSEESADKPFEPSPQKLKKAREKGDFARSSDLTAAASMLALALVFISSGPLFLTNVAAPLVSLLRHSGLHANSVSSEDHFFILREALSQTVFSAGLLFGCLFVGAALSIVAQQGFVFAPSKLKPKLNRISLVQNAKNKFGRRGLFEFSKSFVKLLLFSALLGIFLSFNLNRLISITILSAKQSISETLMLALEFLGLVALLATLIGGVDWFWQIHEHLRRNKMSFKELKDETKESEGDPYLKSERKKRAYDIANSQLMSEVAHADVVMVNPTHFAVALKWDRNKRTAPVCVAKGVDEAAKTIRRHASEAGVPLHLDPPTTRALYATTNIGDEVPPSYYKAVAAAIRFSEQMRLKAKARIV